MSTSWSVANQRGQINGDRVEFDFKVLDLTSPQDTYTYSGTTNASNIGISGGTSGPPSLTLGGSHSNLDGRYASTTQTAGIYAGDLGFKGRVGDTSLTGAVITSTEAAEQLGRNSLVTDHLQLNDVTNFETLKGSTGGVDLTISPAPSGSKIPFIPTGYGLGFGNIDESNSGVTKSGINTTNLTVTDPQGQMQGLTPQQIIDLTKTHVTTDNVDTNNNGQLDLTINPAAAQASLDRQLGVTKAFTSEAVPAAISKVNGKIDTLKDERKIAEANHDFDRVKQLDQQITNWQKGAVLINSLAAALANPIGGLAGAAGAALSPVLSYEIGQVFKQGIDVNGKPYGEGSLPHILAHLVAGALSAVISGSGTPIDTTQIITQAASAAGAEALTPYIAKLLYADATNADNFKVSDLTADQKAVITNIAHMIGTGIGAAVTGAAGGDFGELVTNGVVGEQSAGAAVANNEESIGGPYYGSSDEQMEQARIARIEEAKRTQQATLEYQQSIESVKQVMVAIVDGVTVNYAQGNYGKAFGWALAGVFYVGGEAIPIYSPLNAIAKLGKNTILSAAVRFQVSKGMLATSPKVLSTSTSITKPTLLPLGIATTGRAAPKNVMEQAAMNYAKNNPELGTELSRIVIGDRRYVNMAGEGTWKKMEVVIKSNNGKTAIVHYMARWKNGTINAVDDFKFK